MTEAVTLMQDYIFRTLEFPELYVMNAIENTASRQLKRNFAGPMLAPLNLNISLATRNLKCGSFVEKIG